MWKIPADEVRGSRFGGPFNREQLLFLARRRWAACWSSLCPPNPELGLTWYGVGVRMGVTPGDSIGRSPEYHYSVQGFVHVDSQL